MAETWVRCYCSNCEHEWSDNPSELGGPDASVTCPSCGTSRRVAELLLTQQDLATVRELHAE